MTFFPCRYDPLVVLFPADDWSRSGGMGFLRRHSLLHQRDGEDLGVTLGNEVCAELLRPRVYDGLLRYNERRGVRVGYL